MATKDLTLEPYSAKMPELIEEVKRRIDPDMTWSAFAGLLDMDYHILANVRSGYRKLSKGQLCRLVSLMIAHDMQHLWRELYDEEGESPVREWSHEAQKRRIVQEITVMRTTRAASLQAAAPRRRR